MTVVMDGKAVAHGIHSRVAAQVSVTYGEEPTAAPGLATSWWATILPVPDTSPRNGPAAGMRDLHRLLPGNATQEDLTTVIEELAADQGVSGSLLQLPPPRGWTGRR
ncbi:hypothetical protein [Streptomyces tendae]|uniref:hypothetical protein n=1 Tax=Streptomyces tendae TaxID=1932 RepID=UPI0036B2058C